MSTKKTDTEELFPEDQTTETPKLKGKSIGSALGESGLEAAIVEPFDNLLDEQIKIIGADMREGEYGDYVIIYHEGSDSSILGLSCGGKVVVRKISKLIESKAFPVIATCRKVKRYYDLV